MSDGPRVKRTDWVVPAIVFIALFLARVLVGLGRSEAGLEILVWVFVAGGSLAAVVGSVIVAVRLVQRDDERARRR